MESEFFFNLTILIASHLKHIMRKSFVYIYYGGLD
jgi:hypothetical protein